MPDEGLSVLIAIGHLNAGDERDPKKVNQVLSLYVAMKLASEPDAQIIFSDAIERVRSMLRSSM